MYSKVFCILLLFIDYVLYTFYMSELYNEIILRIYIYMFSVCIYIYNENLYTHVILRSSLLSSVLHSTTGILYCEVRSR